MSKSHTNKATASASELRLVPGLGLIDPAKPDLPASLVDKLDGELELFAARMHEGLMAAALAVGLEVFAELLEANVVEVAGPKGKHNAGRSAVRHGSEPAKVPLGGRMVQVAKPRVRRADGTGEVPLEAWAALSSRDLLNAHTVASMLTGVSSRHYATTLEPAGESIGEASSSTSHSAVSRRFVAATRKGLAAFRSRPLDSRRFLVCYIDGFGFGDETMVGALGVDAEGHKMPLTVVQGSTENKTVCTALLNNLEDRGFDPAAGVLFVIDGGKGIYHAITSKWGDVALIARCGEHKRRNVLAHLNLSEHTWVNRALNDAWRSADAGEAEAKLRSLAVKLERVNPDAAASLREGLAETVTINRLGVTPGSSLARTLSTTNPMESTIDIVKVHARNVKRWQGHDMRLRWAAAGMLAAEHQYRRVNGYRQLDDLARRITATIAQRAELAEAS
jgi:transposase-like protein